MRFFVGLHQPSDAWRFPHAFVSVNRLRNRRSDFAVNDWIMDSGAFTQIANHGRFLDSVEDYARQIDRWRRCGSMLRAVAQDYMCEPWAREKTGLTTREHQRLTVDRYQYLHRLAGDIVMPVLQGEAPQDYAVHLADYGGLLPHGCWTGVGSVCKRKSAAAIEEVLFAVKRARPDLRLHGFGLKLSALKSATVRDLLYSADSMAWSFAARKRGENPNHWSSAAAFVRRIDEQLQQRSVFECCI